MSPVASLPLRRAPEPGAEPARPTGVSTLTQADFLKLLTAQLTNQDPTEPTDNAEFVSQMAQFSTVDGIDRLNKAVAEIAARFPAPTPANPARPAAQGA